SEGTFFPALALRASVADGSPKRKRGTFFPSLALRASSTARSRSDRRPIVLPGLDRLLQFADRLVQPGLPRLTVRRGKAGQGYLDLFQALLQVVHLAQGGVTGHRSAQRLHEHLCPLLVPFDQPLVDLQPLRVLAQVEPALGG